MHKSPAALRTTKEISRNKVVLPEGIARIEYQQPNMAELCVKFKT